MQAWTTRSRRWLGMAGSRFTLDPMKDAMKHPDICISASVILSPFFYFHKHLLIVVAETKHLTYSSSVRDKDFGNLMTLKPAPRTLAASNLLLSISKASISVCLWTRACLMIVFVVVAVVVVVVVVENKLEAMDTAAATPFPFQPPPPQRGSFHPTILILLNLNSQFVAS